MIINIDFVSVVLKHLQVIAWVIVQNKEERFTEEINNLKIAFKFFTDHETHKTRWTSLNIQDLDKILEKLPFQNILDSEYDRRLSPIDHLSCKQLKFECTKNGLSSNGKKV